ncbi:hypothetical protein [Yersinia phage vB_YenM_P8]
MVLGKCYLDPSLVSLCDHTMQLFIWHKNHVYKLKIPC